MFRRRRNPFVYAFGSLLFGNRRRRYVTLVVCAIAAIIGCMSSHSTDKQTARVEHAWYVHNLRESKQWAKAKVPTGKVCQTTTKTVTTTSKGGTASVSRKGHSYSVTHRTPVNSTQTTTERTCK